MKLSEAYKLGEVVMQVGWDCDMCELGEIVTCGLGEYSVHRYFSNLQWASLFCTFKISSDTSTSKNECRFKCN